MFQGAADEVVERAREEGDDDLLTQGGTALEVCFDEFGAEGRWRLLVDQRGLFEVRLVRRSSVSCRVFGERDYLADAYRGYMVWKDYLYCLERPSVDC